VCVYVCIYIHKYSVLLIAKALEASGPRLFKRERVCVRVCILINIMYYELRRRWRRRTRGSLRERESERVYINRYIMHINKYNVL
jgi:hypothetical protein